MVQRWIDDAVTQLSNMMYTCFLEAVRGYPGGLAESPVALLLEATAQPGARTGPIRVVSCDECAILIG